MTGVQTCALPIFIKVWRSEVGDYCSNRLGDLKSKATKLLNKGKTSSRTTLDFVQSVTKTFEQLDSSAKVKQSRGDTTADPVKFRTAVTAFWKAYK